MLAGDKMIELFHGQASLRWKRPSPAARSGCLAKQAGRGNAHDGAVAQAKKEAALLRGPSSGSFEIRRSAVQGDDLAIQNSITLEGAVFGV
jgi:hypothetical protein